MSLIADALKRAQEQRQGAAGRSDMGARRLLTPSGPLRVPSRKGREVPRSLAMAGFGLAAAIVIFGLVVILSPRAEIRAATAWAAGVAEDGQGGPVGGIREGAIGEGGIGEGGIGEGAIGGEAIGGEAIGGEGRPGGAPVQGGADGGGAWADQERGRVAEGAEASGVLGAYAGDASNVEARRPGEAPGRAEGVWDPEDRRGADGGEREPASSFRMTLAGEAENVDLGARALGAQQAGDLEGAATLYRRALASRPWDPQLHNNLGTVYRALGMSGQAYEAFEAALTADRGYAPAWNNLGLMLEGMGRLDDAVDAYREAILRAPENGGARVNLANAYQAMGLTMEARSLLEAALREDPGLPEAHYALARLLEATGDEAGARRHFTLFLNTGRGSFGELEVRVRRHIGAGEG